jgi:hypothetical protein
MANSQQTEEKRESLWTLAAAVGFMLGVLGVAMALDHSSVRFGKAAPSAVIHDRAFQTAITNFDYEMTKARPELFSSFSDGDIRIGNCLGFLTATMRPDRRRHFSELPGGEAYADCLPLRAARLSPGPEYHLAPAASLGRVLAERLDPSALKGTLPDWITRFRRLRDAKIEDTAVSAQSVTLNHGGQRIALQILASANIAGKEMEDLLVRVTGTGAARYIVLAQGADGSLRPMAEQTLMAITNPTSMPTD